MSDDNLRAVFLLTRLSCQINTSVMQAIQQLWPCVPSFRSNFALYYSCHHSSFINLCFLTVCYSFQPLRFSAMISYFSRHIHSSSPSSSSSSSPLSMCHLSIRSSVLLISFAPSLHPSLPLYLHLIPSSRLTCTYRWRHTHLCAVWSRRTMHRWERVCVYS